MKPLEITFLRVFSLQVFICEQQTGRKTEKPVFNLKLEKTVRSTHFGDSGSFYRKKTVQRFHFC